MRQPQWEEGGPRAGGGSAPKARQWALSDRRGGALGVWGGHRTSPSQASAHAHDALRGRRRCLLSPHALTDLGPHAGPRRKVSVTPDQVPALPGRAVRAAPNPAAWPPGRTRSGSHTAAVVPAQLSSTPCHPSSPRLASLRPARADLCPLPPRPSPSLTSFRYF